MGVMGSARGWFWHLRLCDQYHNVSDYWSIQECDHTLIEVNDKDSTDFSKRRIDSVWRGSDSLHIWLASRRRQNLRGKRLAWLNRSGHAFRRLPTAINKSRIRLQNVSFHSCYIRLHYVLLSYISSDRHICCKT